MKRSIYLLQSGNTICEKNWAIKEQSTIFHRIYFVKDGEAYYKQENTNSNLVKLEKNNLYFFPTMVPYSIYHNPDRPLNVLWFHVEFEVEYYNNFAQLEIKNGSILHALLKTLEKFIDKSKYYEELLDIFRVFIVILREDIPLYQGIEELNQYEHMKFKEIIEYINKNINTSLKVEDIAARFNMDRFYFCRNFKKIFRMTPKRYIIARKMSAASRALVKGASVYEAAEASGYKDEKSFSRAFKKYMEVSPSEYKRNYYGKP